MRGTFGSAPPLGPHAMAMLMVPRPASPRIRNGPGGFRSSEPSPSPITGDNNSKSPLDSSHAGQQRPLRCNLMEPHQGADGERHPGFRELRSLYRDNDEKLAGPRWEWLTTILTEQDTKSFSRFMETAKAPDPQYHEVCAWCNARVYDAQPKPVTRRHSAFTPVAPSAWEMMNGGGMAGLHDFSPPARAAPSNAPKVKAAGSVPGRCCEVCAKWHCQKCCDHRFEVATLLPSAKPTGRRQTVRTQLECCNKCRRFLDVATWRHEQVRLQEIWREVYPHQASEAEMLASPRQTRPRQDTFGVPDGLANSSRQLLISHGQLKQRVTVAETALAQLDGLARTAEMHHVSGTKMPDELTAQMLASQKKVSNSLVAIEAALRDLGKVACGDPARPPNDERVKETLTNHIKRQLEVLKPRAGAALARADHQTAAAKQLLLEGAAGETPKLAAAPRGGVNGFGFDLVERAS